MLAIKRNSNNESVIDMERKSDALIEIAKEYVDRMPLYKPVNLDEEINAYIEKEIKKNLFKTPITAAREVRTFGNEIPKQDLVKFTELQKYKDKDISYIVYESLEIL